MKKLMALLLALCMAFALCACGDSADPVVEETDPAVEQTQAVTEEVTEPPVEESAYTYTVNVLDEGGNPIVGAAVQMCQGENCKPMVTDENGAAVYNVDEEADYEVKLIMLPAGYEYATEEQVFHFDAGSYEMTITLKAVA